MRLKDASIRYIKIQQSSFNGSFIMLKQREDYRTDYIGHLLAEHSLKTK